MKTKEVSIFSNMFFIIFLISFLAFSALQIWAATKVEQLGIRVEDKQTTVSGKQTRFLIFTEKETFSVEDTLIGSRYNSADDFHKIKKDKCYNVYVRGIRNGFLSMFRNIERLKEVDCNS